MSQQTQDLIGYFMNCDFPSSETGVDEPVQSLQNILCNAQFAKECRLKRHAVRKLANAKHRDPTNIDIRKLFHQRL